MSSLCILFPGIVYTTSLMTIKKVDKPFPIKYLLYSILSYSVLFGFPSSSGVCHLYTSKDPPCPAQGLAACSGVLRLSMVAPPSPVPLTLPAPPLACMTVQSSITQESMSGSSPQHSQELMHSITEPTVAPTP